jgi:SAM-dependent methyltransferase
MKNYIWSILLKILKRWSRSGIYDQVIPIIDSSPNQIISVGGYGDVDNFLRTRINRATTELITFDIDADHAPDVVGNVQEIDKIKLDNRLSPDVILALEVFEHVQEPEKAISACFNALTRGGTLVFSTPWIIPIHDRPNDFFRYTPEAIYGLTKNFSQVIVYARGNYLDSVICLMLRALWAKEFKTKLLMLTALIPSLLLRKPKLYADLKKIDSTIGYIAICIK